MTEEPPQPDAPRGRGRPKDPERRTAIVRAARGLFLEHGVVAASMDAVARTAGVSKRTIYSHFPDKEALFRAVIEAESGGYRRPPEEQEPTDLPDLRRRLIEFGTNLVELLSRPGVVDLGRLLLSESRRHPGLAERFHSGGPESAHRKMTALLARAHDRGLLRVEDPALAADQLLSMWPGRRHLRLQLGLAPPPGRPELERHVTACVDMFLRAYAADRRD